MSRVLTSLIAVRHAYNVADPELRNRMANCLRACEEHLAEVYASLERIQQRTGKRRMQKGTWARMSEAAAQARRAWGTGPLPTEEESMALGDNAGFMVDMRVGAAYTDLGPANRLRLRHCFHTVCAQSASPSVRESARDLLATFESQDQLERDLAR